MLPETEYIFDEEGVIAHHADTSLNGIHTDDGIDYYFIDGVKAYMGLIKIGEDYYYFRNSGAQVKGQSYWITKTNGLVPEGSYVFDEDGKLILDGIVPGEPNDPEKPNVGKDGIVEENGDLYYYENGKLTYAGLIVINNDYYYINSSGKVIHSRNYWITKTNGLLPEKSYKFDETGKIVFNEEQPSQPTPPVDPEQPDGEVKNGIVAENGDLYYYENGKLTYVGLIIIDGDYYYVNSSCRVIHSRNYWITRTNGLLSEKSYTFDETGKIVFDQEQPSRPTPPVDPENPTEPDDELKNGIVEENGDQYYYVNGERTYAGLVIIDGEYYYVNSSYKVIHSRRYWITKTNGLLPEMSYDFDDQGRIVLD